MRRKLTDTERAARVERRAAARLIAATRADENRSWHEKRKALAEVARARLRRRRAKERAKAEKRDRSPKVTVLPHEVSKHGNRIDSTLGAAVFGVRKVTGNHEYRRAVGQRGHVRPPRRRELPAAMARRLERARQEWTS